MVSARRDGAPALHVGEHITRQAPYVTLRPRAVLRLIPVLVTSAWLSACASSSPRPSAARAEGTRPGALAVDPAVPLPAAHQRWLDSTLATLSLRERVGQMVMIWVLGDFTNAREPGFLKIVDQVQRDGVGGLVMSLGSPIEVATKVNYLQGRAKVPLLVGSDVEPGLGRLEGGFFSQTYPSAGTATVLPSNMAIGATGRVDDAMEAGRITGTEARAVGIHVAFSPDVDVNNNPSNPVINVRSFGEDPLAVSRMSAAFVTGVQRSGTAATAKHFPGHGDTDTDSHLGLPVIQVARARMDSVELLPFASAIRAGAAAIMTAHIALPKAYGDSTPATLSPRILQGLLRDTLGFRGMTFTDAMTMEALQKTYGMEESVVRAVEAGNDVLLMPLDVTRAIDAVVRAVESGRIKPARIDASVKRILSLKLRTGAIANPIVSLDALRDSVATPAHWAIANGIAQRAITLIRDSAGLVPIAKTASVLLLTYAPDAEVAAGVPFGAEMRAQDRKVRNIRLSPHSNAAELDSLAIIASLMDRVVVYSYTRTLEGDGRLAIPSQIASFVSRLAATGKLVVVAGGNPYQLKQVPQTPTYLVTYGRGEALERAAARAVFGAAPISGRVPVSLPGFFVRGDGLSRGSASTESPVVPSARVDALRDSLHAVLDRAVADGAFPGAYVAVGTADGVLAEYGAGQLDVADTTRPSARTVWDLASLTKVIGTTSAMLQLVGQRKVALDSPVVRYLPEWTAAGAKVVTVRQLMTHSAGLPAWRPLYKEAASAEEAVGQLYATGPDTEPGKRYLYSDLGFMLLGKLVERVSGEPLARYDSAHLFSPLGMVDTRYLPPAEWRNRIAPTEQDPWRQRKLRGEVHDENAAMIGGVSGHAGLFSSGRDLARFARMYLKGGALEGQRVFDAPTLAQFTRAQDTTISRRALGWETPTGGNSAGHGMSPSAFGHTGFTGTSLWMDPQQGIFVLLLTNRVNPTRQNLKIGRVRQSVADAALAALGMSATSRPGPGGRD
jgi:beta-glucosidase-like glycosyl hydrolase/CubicO group peptidase (beta-lactamase class C family)